MSTPATFKIVCATPCAGNVQKNTKSNLCTTFVLNEEKYNDTIPLNLSNICNVVLPPSFAYQSCDITNDAIMGLKDGQLINFYNFSIKDLVFNINMNTVIYYPEVSLPFSIKVINEKPVIGYYSDEILYITGGKPPP
jgi:hypothetical protein